MPSVAELVAQKEAAKVASAKPLEMLNTPEKRKRFAELRAKMSRGRLAVDGDPTKHYFWAGVEDHYDMARLEGLGYAIVREPNASEVLRGEAEPLIKANGLREDGTYVVGDVILTQCDRETYEYLCLADSERHEELASGAQRDFRREAEDNGVPVFDHIK